VGNCACDKTQLDAQSLQRKALYKKNAHSNKSNPNYYPLIASVDSSSIGHLPISSQ